MSNLFLETVKCRTEALRPSLQIECYHCRQAWATQRVSWRDAAWPEIKFSLCLCDGCARLPGSQIIDAWIDGNVREGESKGLRKGRRLKK